MYWYVSKAVSPAILWAGWAFIAAIFLLVLWNLLQTVDDWGGLFVQRIGDPPHLSRYLLFFGSVILSLRFLIAMIRADEQTTTAAIKEAFQFLSGLDTTGVAGISSVAYLLSKVTDGKILTLFGRRQD
jgi:hypothetical protein